MDNLRERVARAIAWAVEGEEEGFKAYLRHADGAIPAVFNALGEPSKGMVEAEKAITAFWEGHPPPSLAWTVMLSAARREALGPEAFDPFDL